METSPHKSAFFKELFPGIKAAREAFDWPEIEEKDVVPTYMKSLNNLTFKADCKIDGVKPILAKRFGKGYLDSLLNRNLDNSVARTLGELQIGPKVYHTSPEMRIEEFVECTEFTNENMQSHSKRNLLCYYIQLLHRTNVEDMPKTSLLTRIISEDLPLFKLSKQAAADNQRLFSTKEKQIIDKVIGLLDPQEMEWVRSIVQPLEKDLVLSHNDLINGNILNLPTKELLLIDFEYSSYNFSMFDIANFITETLIDYTIPEPPYFEFKTGKRDSDERVQSMIKYYLLFASFKEPLSISQAMNFIGNQDEAEKELIKRLGGPEALSSALQTATYQLHVGYLLCHYLWIQWSVMMAKSNNVEFGYLEFADQRCEDYFYLKNLYFNSGFTK